MSGPGIICEEDHRVCELCGKHAECRPYGPNGEDVCYQCGMKDEAALERGFRKHVLGEDPEKEPS